MPPSGWRNNTSTTTSKDTDLDFIGDADSAAPDGELNVARQATGEDIPLAQFDHIVVRQYARGKLPILRKNRVMIDRLPAIGVLTRSTSPSGTALVYQYYIPVHRVIYTVTIGFNSAVSQARIEREAGGVLKSWRWGAAALRS